VKHFIIAAIVRGNFTGICVRAAYMKNKTLFYKEKRKITRFLCWQLVVAVSLSIIIAILWNPAAAISTLIGGLLVLIPNIFLAIIFFALTKSNSSKKMVRACYMGEALKIVLIAVLFVLVLHWYAVMLAPLLIGFCGTYAVYLMSAFL